MTDSVRDAWHKSSYSNGSGGNCIEVANTEPHVKVRDSKDPEGPVLAFPAAAWAAFIGEIRARGNHFEG